MMDFFYLLYTNSMPNLIVSKLNLAHARKVKCREDACFLFLTKAKITTFPKN